MIIEKKKMELFAITKNQIAKESKIVAITCKTNESVIDVTPRRTHNYNIFLGAVYKGKIKL